MSKKTRFGLILAVVLTAAIGGLIAAIAYYNDLPQRLSQHETIVLGQTTFVPGSQAALRVLVRDSKDAAPLAGASIRVSLRPKAGGEAVPLFKGTTDPSGSANVSFKVPQVTNSDQSLVIETSSPLGQDSVERPVTVKRDYRVLLTTDKPIYQPGQEIHLRALALSAFDLVPAASQSLELVIADGKGNKVFRKTVTTSAYGAASADFQLASEVNSGAYKITAQLGSSSSEKTVQVEPYSLPKFQLALKTTQSFYLPGAHARGVLNAGYFFGKPVAGSEVKIEGYTFDVQRSVAFTLQGKTNADGNFEFEFDLPAYLTGAELDRGAGRFYLLASVTDQARHTELANLSIPVARSALVVEAIPEGGQFRQGVDNILYVLASYPDGSPAEAELSVIFRSDNSRQAVVAGPYGLAEIHYTPKTPYQNIQVTARDRRGASVSREFNFQGTYAEETVLLRPEKPVYKVGDAMQLTILTSQPAGTVYLDIVRERQTVSTRAVEVINGRAELVVDLTPDLYGTLELSAYKILRSGATSRDTRLVVVDQAEGLKIALTPGQQTYRPGDPGTLGIQVTGSDGQGAQAALGVAIVDESVFALAEQDPGFAKLYFLLENELLKPKYDLHGYTLPDLLGPGLPETDPTLLRAVDGAAQASLAAAAPQAAAFALQANSHTDALSKASELQSGFFKGLGLGMAGLLVLIPLVVLGLNGYALHRQKVLGRSLLLALGLVGLGFLLIMIWPLSRSYAVTPGERIGILLQGLEGSTVLGLGVLALGCTLAASIYSIARRDTALGASLLLLVGFLGVAFVLIYSFSRSQSSPPDSLLFAMLVAFLLLPLAFLLRAGGFASRRKVGLALVSLPLGLLPLLLIALIAFSGVAASPINGVNQLGVGVEDKAMPLGGGRAGIAPPTAAPAATQTAGEAAHQPSGSGAGPAGQVSAAEPPRLRQYFPETMLWVPDALSDAQGRLNLSVPVADSITTWRITALASTQDGRLGSTSAALRVFQDFFIDLDLPQSLTVGDEVSIPVGVFNYLAQEQSVKLELTQAGWFELLDEPVKTLQVASNEISVVYFKIRAKSFGDQPFRVTATGSKLSDAIQKSVHVFPDGKQIAFSQADRLEAGNPVTQKITIPADAIPGTQKLLVKIYPGMLSQVVDGMDGILRMPNGCFEQTSSTTYPNVLVLDYLKATNQAAPEVQLKAEQYINLGYQRLATFEVKSSGGFSLFGNEPADRMLTAYGLQEFSDMSRVYHVDPALIERAGRWLLAQQESDGSWKNDTGLVHENTWQQLGNDRLPITAYIAWSLVEAGFNDDAGTQKGLDYVRENAAQAQDPYTLALVANALVASDLKAGSKLTPASEDALARLAALAQRDGNTVFWASQVVTFMGGKGQTGSIETTALAAYAFMRANSNPVIANAALTFLVQQKDSFGTWHSTQATVLSLKALIQSVRGSGEQTNAVVTITLNGGQAKTIQVTPENFDVVQLASFDDINPGANNSVQIKVEGQGSLMYQVSGSYYLPWEKLSAHPDLVPVENQVSIDVKYDRTQLAVNDTVNVTVTVKLNQPGARAEQALIDLGIPPGFTVLAEDLSALVERSKDFPKDYAGPIFSRYELTGRQVLVYANNLQNSKPFTFSFRLQARFPLNAKAPASSAYDYYNPGISGENAPQMLVVKP